MITPIRTLTIAQICERKEDLLVSSEDIKKLSKHVKERTIDEFAERAKSVLESYHEQRWIDEIAEQMKGGGVE